MAWSVERENEDHFEVVGDTGAFKVSKAALSPSALARMRGMARGGVVGRGARGRAKGAPDSTDAGTVHPTYDDGPSTGGPALNPPPVASAGPPRAPLPPVDVRIGKPVVDAPQVTLEGPPTITRVLAPTPSHGVEVRMGRPVIEPSVDVEGQPTIQTASQAAYARGEPVVRVEESTPEQLARQEAWKSTSAYRDTNATSHRALRPGESARMEAQIRSAEYDRAASQASQGPTPIMVSRPHITTATEAAFARGEGPDPRTHVANPTTHVEASTPEQLALQDAWKSGPSFNQMGTVSHRPLTAAEAADFQRRVDQYASARAVPAEVAPASPVVQFEGDPTVRRSTPQDAGRSGEVRIGSVAPGQPVQTSAQLQPVAFAQPQVASTRMADGGVTRAQVATAPTAPPLATSIAVREPGEEQLRSLDVPIPREVIADAPAVVVSAPPVVSEPVPSAPPTQGAPVAQRPQDPDLAAIWEAHGRPQQEKSTWGDLLKTTPDQATMAYKALLAKGHRHEADMLARSILKPADAVSMGLLTPEDIGAQPGGVHASAAQPSTSPQEPTAPSSSQQQASQQPSSGALVDYQAMRLPTFQGSGMYGAGTILSAAKAAENEMRGVGSVQQQVAQSVAARQEANAQEQRAWAQLQDQRQAEGRAVLGKMLDDIKGSKVDPDHFFADKSGFDRVRMGVGMLLGGIGSALTGQPNLAAQFIQRSIDRDIDAQKADLTKKQSVYSYYLEQTKDDRAASAMTRAVLTNAAAAELDAAATRGGGDVASQQHKVMAAQWHQSALEQANQAVSLQTQSELQRAQLQGIQLQREMMLRYMNGQGGQQGGGYVPTASVPVFTGDIGGHAKALQEQRLDWKDAQGNRRFSFGKPGQAKDANEQLSELSQVRDDINELEQTARQASLPGAAIPWSEVRAKWDALQGHFSMLSPSALTAVKRLNDNELNIGKQEAGDSIWKTKLNGGAALKVTKELLQRRQDAVLRAQGVDERFLADSVSSPQATVFTAPRR